ncbi:MAG: glutamylcysteine synthetase [uncultured bacterium (gcode 4)]|uniref:Glutamylcysteine synthetase n=1 Tax=uncultured bacterium (gcode 4) TaxID=1234023 RepID=K2FXZ3_9BACT|nr:MAG: glutamylcysteine synthetase [uncultured bacterium (gcode 4)]
MFSSVQLHLDLHSDEMVLYFNILNKITWLKALLFSNSPNFFDKEERCYCIRDLLWEHSACAVNSDNIEIHNYEFNNYQEILENVLNTSVFFVVRADKRIYFKPYRIKDFLQKSRIYGCYIEGCKKHEISFSPQIEDLKKLKPYNNIVLTSRGTAEIRSECIQPFKDLMSHSAFHIGIVHNMEKIKDHLLSVEKELDHTYSELRKFAIYEGYDIQKHLNFDIQAFIYELLLLTKEGIVSRGKNEEKFIDCLFDRLEKKTNPAIEWMNKMDQGMKTTEIIKAMGIWKWKKRFL